MPAQGKLTAAMAAYHASFIRTGDPNTERAPGSPSWPRYSPQGGGGTSLALALPKDGGVRAERGYRKEQCDYCAGTSRCQGGPGAE